MLKKLLMNKKFLIGVTVIAIGATIVLSGITGAWWHIESGSDADTTGFQMGELGVSVGLSINSQTIQEVYQPGDESFFDITIKNTGSIVAFVKLDFDKFTSEEDSNVIVHVNDTIIDSLQSNAEKYITVKEGNCYIFLDNDKNIYFELSKDAEVTVKNCVTVELIGGDDNDPDYSDDEIGMKDRMGSEVNITLNWEATQYKREAILAKFHVDIDDEKVMHLIFPS